MKVTNLLLAALLTVSTAAFANTAVITAKAVDSVLAKMTPKAVEALGVQAGMKAGQSNAAVANGIAALLNTRSNDSQVKALATALESKKASVTDLKLVVAAMASQPVEKKNEDRSSQGVQLGERADNRSNPDSVIQEDERSANANNAPRSRLCTTKEDPTSILESGCSKVDSPVAIENYERIKAETSALTNGTLAGTLNNVVASSKSLVLATMKVLGQKCENAIETVEALKASSCGLVKAFQPPNCAAIASR